MPKLPIWMYALGVSALLNIAGGLWGWHELDRARVAEAKLETRTAERDQAVTANDSNARTISALSSTNDKNRKTAAMMTSAVTVLSDLIKTVVANLAASEAKAKDLRGKLYASDAKLREWGARAVPDSLSGVLRERWASVGGAADGIGGGLTGPLQGTAGGIDGSGVRGYSLGAVVDSIAR